MTTECLIRPIQAADRNLFAGALELLNRTQGRGLFAASYLDERTADPDSLVLGAFHDSELVAVGVAQVIRDFEFYLPFDAQIADELNGKAVGSFSTLSVREDLQGRGIGQGISQARLRWLRERGCDVILGVSWVSGQRHTSDRVFEKLGFRAVRLVEEFFRVAALKNPFECPACRVTPCVCSAVLYRFDL